MPVTAVSNHNGIISNEIRVIYVVHQRTGLPLFMRYVPGNVIDASTIRRTLLELDGMGVSVSFALLDAGYYNGKNADALYDAKISFVTRVHNNNKVFTDAAKAHRAGLFMLVSSREVAKSSILSLYYTRNQVEELFRIGKGEGKMLPLEIHSEDTLRGHLMITLLSTAILKILQDRLLGTKLSTSEVFSVLSHQGALVTRLRWLQANQ